MACLAVRQKLSQIPEAVLEVDQGHKTSICPGITSSVHWLRSPHRPPMLADTCTLSARLNDVITRGSSMALEGLRTYRDDFMFHTCGGRIP